MTASNGRTRNRPRTEAQKAADLMRPGRPASISDETVSKGVTMRLTPPEYEQFTREAGRLNMSLSVYLRHCWQTTREQTTREGRK